MIAQSLIFLHKTLPPFLYPVGYFQYGASVPARKPGFFHQKIADLGKPDPSGHIDYDVLLCS